MECAIRITTSDGVTLHATDSGDVSHEPPLVLLHGWGQTSLLFREQVAGLAASRRVIAFDMRGHGLSDKPNHGYRIARLAADLRDVLDALRIERTDLLGWSMGASVVWSYLELFGSARVRSVVLVDQPAAVVAWPWTSSAESADSGAILPAAGLAELAAAIRADASGAVVRDFVRSMFSEPAHRGAWDLVADQIRSTPIHASVPLLIDHAMQDWRDVLPRIDVPALVIGCEGSHVDPRSQHFVAARVPGARVHVFERGVAGSHFPFLEAPEAFNAVVDGFLREQHAPRAADPSGSTRV